MVYRWTFDDLAGDTYTVPTNPNAMTKLKSARSLTTRATAAIAGQTLYFEGSRSPQSWQFSGVLLSKDHYDALDTWVYNKGRITITDHFLRVITVVLTDFDAVPKRSRTFYWRHDYTVSGLVSDIDTSDAVTDPP